MKTKICGNKQKREQHQQQLAVAAAAAAAVAGVKKSGNQIRNMYATYGDQFFLFALFSAIRFRMCILDSGSSRFIRMYARMKRE